MLFPCISPDNEPSLVTYLIASLRFFLLRAMLSFVGCDRDVCKSTTWYDCFQSLCFFYYIEIRRISRTEYLVCRFMSVSKFLRIFTFRV